MTRGNRPSRCLSLLLFPSENELQKVNNKNIYIRIYEYGKIQNGLVSLVRESRQVNLRAKIFGASRLYYRQFSSPSAVANRSSARLLDSAVGSERSRGQGGDVLIFQLTAQRGAIPRLRR